MVYREYREKEKDQEDCVQYSGDEFKNTKIDRFGVYTVYCDEDEEDEEWGEKNVRRKYGDGDKTQNTSKVT